MKKITLILASMMIVYSCKNEKQQEKTPDQHEITNADASKKVTENKDLNWDEIPTLNNIGSFPFITAPKGLKIKNEKDGMSEVFDDAKMENYTGNGIYTTEGKLAVLSFDGENGDFSRSIFDQNIYAYFDKIGAKMIYKGNFPENENEKTQLEKNLWNGKYGTYAIIREGEAPFTVYAFKNNDKKYMVNVQANSAQGTVFMIEILNSEKP